MWHLHPATCGSAYYLIMAVFVVYEAMNFYPIRKENYMLQIVIGQFR